MLEDSELRVSFLPPLSEGAPQPAAAEEPQPAPQPGAAEDPQLPERRAGGPDFAKLREFPEISERAALQKMRDFVLGGGICVFCPWEADRILISYLDDYVLVAQRLRGMERLALAMRDSRHAILVDDDNPDTVVRASGRKFLV
jgi:hypothetical protein